MTGNSSWVAAQWITAFAVAGIGCSASAETFHQVSLTNICGIAEQWADESGENIETANRAGVDYVLDRTLLTPAATRLVFALPPDGTDATFLGDSLTLGYGCYLSWTKESTGLGQRFTCRRLLCKNGSYLSGGNKCPVIIDGGVIEIPSDATCYLSAHGARRITIASELAGSGILRMIGKAGSTASPQAYYHLTAANSNFTGSLYVIQQDTTHNDFNKALTLSIADARSLGGDLANMTPKALMLTRYAKLIVTNVTTLAKGSNRGVFIGDSTGRIGRISVEREGVFRIETQVTFNGTLYKEDEGTLELAGSAMFGSNGTAAKPVAGQNGLVVSGGVVRVCSAGALDGVNVNLGSWGGRLELAADLSDSDLALHGIRNVKTDTPFILGDGLDRLPFSIDVEGIDVPNGDFAFNYLTVTQTAADNGVRDMLPSFDNPFKGFKMTPIESTNAVAATVSFGLKFTTRGTKIIVR